MHTSLKQFALLALAFVATLWTATHPDYSVPLLPEMWIAGICLWLLWQFPGELNWLWHERPILRNLFVSAIALLCVLGVRLVHSYKKPHSAVWRSCMKMPSLLPKIECSMLLEFTENSGLRQIEYHIVALLVVATMFVLASHWDYKKIRVELAFLTFPTMFAILAILGHFQIIHSGVFGDNWFVTREGGRFATTFFANPGWAWSALVPGIAIASGLLFSEIRREKILAGVAAILIGWAMLISGQRGGYWALTTIALTCAFLYFVRLFRRRRLNLTFGQFWKQKMLILAIIGCVFLIPTVSTLVFSLVGVSFNHNPASVSHERLAIWHIAKDGIWEKLWLGHGYSSWMYAFRPYALAQHRPDIVFPTAHNFWVQALFELGLLHALLIIALLTAAAFSLVRIAQRQSAERVAMSVAFLFGAFFTSTVQEVDHVNTVYYQYALAVGLLFSAPMPRPTHAVPQTSRRLQFAFLGLWLFGLGFLSLQLSWGGYAFGAHPDAFDLTFNRAFRPWGTLVAFPTHENFEFSAFPILSHNGSIKIRGIFPGSRGQMVAATESITLTNGTRAWGAPYFFSTEGSEREEHRIVRFRLIEPPLQTNLGIVEGSGISHWEPRADNARLGGIWCLKDCSFTLQTQRDCAARRLVLTASRPDISENNPLKIEVTQTTTGAVQTLEAKNPTEVLRAPVAPSERRFRITTSSAFNPSIVNKSPDNRELGVMLLDWECD